MRSKPADSPGSPSYPVPDPPVEATPAIARVVQPHNAITIVEGSTFCVSGRDGDIDTRHADGLFVRDMRAVSLWSLLLDGAPIEPLTTIATEPFECLFVGRAAPRKAHFESTLIVERHRLVGQGMREDITLRNYDSEAAGADLTLRVDTDFADLFAVKEHRLEEAARVGHRHLGGDLFYWLDRPDVQRGVRISAPGAISSPRTLSFRVIVPPRGVWTATIEVVPSVQGVDLETLYPAGRALDQSMPALRMRDWREDLPLTATANTVLAGALRTSERDLGALRIRDPQHPADDVVAAGAPWFMALFGRDSLLTSWMMLPFAPRLALGTLRTLARLQGAELNDRTEEQPGRILHEVRLGTGFSLVPGGENVYYGSIDSTPLFVMLVGRALRWGVPAETLKEFEPAVAGALEWILRHGDRDGDGFVEYRRTNDRGLVNQGWKDSFDGISFRDGELARAPIALAEVQGYCYGAFRSAADLFRAWGDEAEAAGWDDRAEQLRQRFDEAFWMPAEGTYALALDRDKKQVDAVASNAGHCLWSGIVPPERADAVVERLLAPDMFTGFGIRTLASSSGAYSPVSYHNGSVWPHDSAIVAAGMGAYGRRDAVSNVFSGLLDALEAFGGRLPELFCGFDRAEKPVPVPYPTSCSPQAWAAAAPFELLRAAIGLELDVPRGRAAVEPAPEALGDVSIARLPAGPLRLDVRAGHDSAAIEGLPRPTAERSASDARP